MPDDDAVFNDPDPDDGLSGPGMTGQLSDPANHEPSSSPEATHILLSDEAHNLLRREFKGSGIPDTSLRGGVLMGLRVVLSDEAHRYGFKTPEVDEFVVFHWPPKPQHPSNPTPMETTHGSM